MKLFLILFSLLMLSACIHYDPLEYYVDGYSPNNETLPTNGYYFRQADSIHLDVWPDAISYMYFLKNGTFNDGSSTGVENLDSLDTWLCKSGEENIRYGPFGFYTIKDDTIFVEYQLTDSFFLPVRATRFEFKAVQSENGLTLVEYNGQPYREEWLFHENDCVPDSVKNWMVTHWKYKLSD